MTIVEKLNNKMKAIDSSYKKSNNEIIVKILVSLPKEYSEVINIANINPSMSSK